MPSSEKTTAVAEITERFTSSSAAVITEYRGLSVKQLTDLRRALGRETTYAVVKNTLTKRAAADAGVPIDEQVFIGPTAIAFINGDPVAAAKGLRDFARANPLLVIKGGILEGKALSADEVNRIADLESREVLLARVAGVLKALPTRAAGLFQAPLSQMARLAQALEEKRSAEAPTSDAVEAPAATETAAEAPAATETPAEAPAATETAAEAPAATETPAEAPAATETPAEPAE
jgi:large subunit ribosomal protein L10